MMIYVIIGLQLQVVNYGNTPRASRLKCVLTIMTCVALRPICEFSILTQRIDVSMDRNLMSWSELYWMCFVIIKFPSQ